MAILKVISPLSKSRRSSKQLVRRIRRTLPLRSPLSIPEDPPQLPKMQVEFEMLSLTPMPASPIRKLTPTAGDAFETFVALMLLHPNAVARIPLGGGSDVSLAMADSTILICRQTIVALISKTDRRAQIVHQLLVVTGAAFGLCISQNDRIRWFDAVVVDVGRDQERHER